MAFPGFSRKSLLQEAKMKKLKDFIYNINDLLIALLVLVAAAVIILWRMDVIMAYPAQIFSDNTASDSQDIDQIHSDDQQGDEGQDANAEGTDNADGSQETEGQETSQSDSLWSGGQLTRDVEVEVSGNTSALAIGCLIDAGLFEDYDEYRKVCEDTGLNHEKVSAGTFTFEKGATKANIARQVNWS
jgi:hypothetical protein